MAVLSQPPTTHRRFHPSLEKLEDRIVPTTQQDLFLAAIYKDLFHRTLDQGGETHRRYRLVALDEAGNPRLVGDIASLEREVAPNGAPVGGNALRAWFDAVDHDRGEPPPGGHMAEVAANISGPTRN